MLACNQLDLQTLGSQPIIAQKSPRSLVQTTNLTFFWVKNETHGKKL